MVSTSKKQERISALLATIDNATRELAALVLDEAEAGGQRGAK